MHTQITVRGVSERLAERLKGIARERGESLNRTVLRLLERAAGLDERRRRLRRYATWTAEDGAEFERALEDQRRVEDELWR